MGRVIPKTVHLIWFGDPVPQQYIKNINQFARLNPDYKIVEWNETDVLDFGLDNMSYLMAAPYLVPRDSVYQLQSDIARYEILYRLGGIYIDYDYRWQKPIDQLLRANHETPTENKLFTAWERQNKYVANGFIATTPQHPILEQAVKQTPVWIQQHGRKKLRANRITGPGGLWTDLVAKQQRRRTIVQRREICVQGQRFLHPVPYDHPEWIDQYTYPEAVAVHEWGHQRLLKELKDD